MVLLWKRLCLATLGTTHCANKIGSSEGPCHAIPWCHTYPRFAILEAFFVQSKKPTIINQHTGVQKTLKSQLPQPQRNKCTTIRGHMQEVQSSRPLLCLCQVATIPWLSDFCPGFDLRSTASLHDLNIYVPISFSFTINFQLPLLRV